MRGWLRGFRSSLNPRPPQPVGSEPSILRTHAFLEFHFQGVLAGRRSSEGQREGSTCHDGPPEMGSTWYSCSGLKPEGATRRREGEKDEGRERKHALSETWASREPYQLHRRRLGPSRGPRSRRG